MNGKVALPAWTMYTRRCGARRRIWACRARMLAAERMGEDTRGIGAVHLPRPDVSLFPIDVLRLCHSIAVHYVLKR